MFDTLVESTARGTSLRAPLFLVGTAAVWVSTFVAVIVVGIFVYDARVSAESDSLKITAIVPPAAAPSPAQTHQTLQRQAPVARGFQAVRRPPDHISAPLPPRPVAFSVGPGITTGTGNPFEDGTNNGPASDDPGAGGDFVAGSHNPPPPIPDPLPVEERKPIPPKVLKVSDLRAGHVVRRVEPPYPPLARTTGIEGTVIVEVTVAENGSVVATRVISGHPMLRLASESAARQWTFTPTVLSGTPVKVVGTITFNFRKS
jgi:periplasmic protein TonB